MDVTFAWRDKQVVLPRAVKGPVRLSGGDEVEATFIWMGDDAVAAGEALTLLMSAGRINGSGSRLQVSSEVASGAVKGITPMAERRVATERGTHGLPPTAAERAAGLYSVDVTGDDYFALTCVIETDG